MFEKQTREEWKEKLLLTKLIYTTRRYKNHSDDQFKLQ